MTIAPYGSGKSLCSGIGALLCTDPSSSMKALAPVMNRIRSVDPSLHNDLQPTQDGRVLVLTGYTRNLTANLANQAAINSDNNNLTGILRQLTRLLGGGG